MACLAIVAAASLGACTPMGAALGVGATAGLAAAEERGISGVSSDVAVKTRINAAWAQEDAGLPIRLSATVYDGRALLTGDARSEAERARAVALAWQADGVANVLNEIRVGHDPSAIDQARDALVTTRLKSRLTFDKDVFAINYVIETYAGVIYILGAARSEDERARVIAHARDLSHVRRVVDHMNVKPRATGSAGAVATQTQEEGR